MHWRWLGWSFLKSCLEDFRTIHLKVSNCCKNSTELIPVLTLQSDLDCHRLVFLYSDTMMAFCFVLGKLVLRTVCQNLDFPPSEWNELSFCWDYHLCHGRCWAYARCPCDTISTTWSRFQSFQIESLSETLSSHLDRTISYQNRMHARFFYSNFVLAVGLLTGWCWSRDLHVHCQSEAIKLLNWKSPP